MAHFFEKIGDKIEKKFEKTFSSFSNHEKPSSHSQQGPDAAPQPSEASVNRYGSFAPQSSGQVKWYVDGASYFWAVSVALERAERSIYILDWWLSPELYLRRPPASHPQYRLDTMLKACAERGVQVNVIVYKEVPQALTLDSAHTKHALEALHPNIKVFRHPDHIVSGSEITADITSAFQSLSMRTFDLATVSGDAVKSLYGTNDDMVLFWAHHEKLCIVDDKLAFMGGLDMCFGRWDTNSHPIADVHPDNMDAIVFPGQDYNNARISDFEDVTQWENNKLDRTKSSRMGWSDISISLSGPILNSLRLHFVDRWNFIWDQKYQAQDPGKYEKLTAPASHDGNEADSGNSNVGARVQLTRSCCPWSSGHPTEHSIANAYIDAITAARYFVYIENQFFITATSDEQRPVTNKIGKALVDRIVRAHEQQEPFQVIVVMPAVPAFAGDLQSDGALGTRAIMEYQYNSINRGGHSIVESLVQRGVTNPHEYINFFNLRNYDRINTSGALRQAEEQSGVQFEDARREYDDEYERGYDSSKPSGDAFRRYAEATDALASDPTWDTVAGCYMAGGPNLGEAPWNGSPESEMDAYVSEELYIHSKVLIADDRLVICGSANLNDRSQRGDHDSEIAVVIEDPTPVNSAMAGQPFEASAFAASLRRQLFRKHLGLLRNQSMKPPPDAVARNWTPVLEGVNEYDWGSDADRLVEDPLSDQFRQLWSGTARTNTEVFSRAFHNVPNDAVRTWDDYSSFFSQHFVLPGADEKEDRGGKVDYGHVVRDEFPGGVAELKAELARVRGNLVEMPLQFLIEVKDLAKQGLSLNGLTDELYT